MVVGIKVAAEEDPELLKIFKEFPSISGGLTEVYLERLNISGDTPFENDTEYFQLLDTMFFIRKMWLQAEEKFEEGFIDQGIHAATGLESRSLLHTLAGFDALKEYCKRLIAQRMKAHEKYTDKLLPRLVRMGKKLEWSEKEIFHMGFLVMAHDKAYYDRASTLGRIQPSRYTEMDAKEILNFVAPHRLHNKQKLLDIDDDSPAEYPIYLTYPVASILLGLDPGEDATWKVDKTALASVLLEEDPVKFHLLCGPDDDKKDKKERSVEEEGEKEDDEDEEEKKKGEKDIFELIREEVENEKLTVEKGEQPEDQEQGDPEAKEKKTGPYTSNLGYLDDHVEWLAALIKLHEAHASAVKHDFATSNSIELREAQGRERGLRLKCEKRVQLTNDIGKFKPRLEKISTFLQLDAFEKKILLLLTANNISLAVNPDGYMNTSVVNFSIGQIILLFCDDFHSEITHRRYFYRTAKLVQNGIITLSENFKNMTELKNMSVNIDRRMLDFIVGLDTEFSEMVEGSHLYTPTVTIDQVILPEEQKELIVTNVLNYEKFQKAKKRLGVDELISYGNGMVMLFYGKSGTGKTMMANALANMLKKRILLINFPSLGSHTSDMIMKYIFRESKLTDSIIFFDECESIFVSRDQEGGRVNLLLSELERHNLLVIMATNRAYDLDEAMHRRVTLAIEFKMPDPLLRANIWKAHIPQSVKVASDVDFNILALKYELTGGFIKNTVMTALSTAVPRDVESPTITMADLSQGAENQLRGRLAMVEFDRRIVPTKGLDEIVVGSEILEKLRKIVRMDKARQILFSEWGYTEMNACDLGTTVLMYGPPGTGKTVAAEAIGFETGKPLKVVNTAELVSKWVGKTGKNIEHIFAEARALDAIIVFDDAESIFGTRHAQQSTSTERYANLDTSVLLYHMERFPGIVVVTTNLHKVIDPAFMRRFRFSIEFEMPKVDEREKLWRTLVPPKAPLEKDIDFRALAEKYNFSGGVIKNCCFKASASAALRSDRVITMNDFVSAAEEESETDKQSPVVYV